MSKMNTRISDYPIDPMFLERWSPRAFTGEPLAEADLLTMLEAARWAPSCYNAQPGALPMRGGTRQAGHYFSICWCR